MNQRNPPNTKPTLQGDNAANIGGMRVIRESVGSTGATLPFRRQTWAASPCKANQTRLFVDWGKQAEKDPSKNSGSVFTPIDPETNPARKQRDEENELSPDLFSIQTKATGSATLAPSSATTKIEKFAAETKKEKSKNGSKKQKAQKPGFVPTKRDYSENGSEKQKAQKPGFVPTKRVYSEYGSEKQKAQKSGFIPIPEALDENDDDDDSAKYWSDSDSSEEDISRIDASATRAVPGAVAVPGIVSSSRGTIRFGNQSTRGNRGTSIVRTFFRPSRFMASMQGLSSRMFAVEARVVDEQEYVDRSILEEEIRNEVISNTFVKAEVIDKEEKLPSGGKQINQSCVFLAGMAVVGIVAAIIMIFAMPTLSPIPSPSSTPLFYNPPTKGPTTEAARSPASFSKNCHALDENDEDACCVGDYACLQAAEDTTKYSLFNPGEGRATISESSCLGFKSCDTAGADGGSAFIESNSCRGGDLACFSAGWFRGNFEIESASCWGEMACQEAAYNRGTFEGENRCCIGLEACARAAAVKGKVTISEGSCIDEHACKHIGEDGGQVSVGRGSCIGSSACFEVAKIIGDVEIGDSSCVGNGSCSSVGSDINNEKIIIGSHACNCDNCCTCLSGGEVVPDNMCNSLGQNECCMDDGSGNIIKNWDNFPLMQPFPIMFENGCNALNSTDQNKCCEGSDACPEEGEATKSVFISEGACRSDEACKYLGVDDGFAFVGKDSCGKEYQACYGAGQRGNFAVESESCFGENACQQAGDNGEFVANTRTCVGFESCRDAGSSIGIATINDDSCHDERACLRLGGINGDVFVGQNSCIGPYACFEAAMHGGVVEIEDGSCNGTGACFRVGKKEDSLPIIIGSGSCNCENCCACLQGGDIVPANSCNTLGPNECCHMDDVTSDLISTLRNSNV